MIMSTASPWTGLLRSMSRSDMTRVVQMAISSDPSSLSESWLNQRDEGSLFPQGLVHCLFDVWHVCMYDMVCCVYASYILWLG